MISARESACCTGDDRHDYMLYLPELIIYFNVANKYWMLISAGTSYSRGWLDSTAC